MCQRSAAGALSGAAGDALFPAARRQPELRVRVYPDKIHLDSHETDLTPSEQEWGEHYWKQVWRAGSSAQAQANAWRQFADRFDAARAAWIARALRPINIGDRPSTTVAPEQPVPAPVPQFPPVAVVTDGKDASWRHAPQARLLPDRWVAIVQSGGRPVLAVAGAAIPRPLAVGPDPQAAAPDVPDDQPAVDEGMKWMIDFDAAEAKGMGLRIRITPQILSAGIDSLFVLGAAASMAPTQTSLNLTQLLDAHHYTDGLEFVRPGTPSNNTAEQRAGYSSDDPGHQRSFATDSAITITTPAADTNARRLGEALGLAPDAIPLVLGTLGNAGERHERDLRSMNTALWQATWGYFLRTWWGWTHDRADAGRDCVGTQSFRQLRAQRRTVSGDPLWKAALRCAAGDLARSLAPSRRRGNAAGQRRVAARAADQAARQHLAHRGSARSRASASARIHQTRTPIWPT